MFPYYRLQEDIVYLPLDSAEKKCTVGILKQKTGTREFGATWEVSVNNGNGVQDSLSDLAAEDLMSRTVMVDRFLSIILLS